MGNYYGKLTTAIQFAASYIMTGRIRYDPFTQEEYWETISSSKKQVPIVPSSNGELNQPPTCPHLKIVMISDTHSRLGELIAQGVIPDGDVLIHAGDITDNGEEDKLREFNGQIGSLPHTHKLVIPGNHEIGFDPDEDERQRAFWIKGSGTRNGHLLFTNCTYLHTKSVVIDGVKFYGASWHPLPRFPFYRKREDLKEYWKAVPMDTDVVVTHSPPLGYLDIFPPDERWGCQYLLEKVEEVKPALHVFGHVHPCYGAMSNGHTTFVNAGMVKDDSKGFNHPLIFYVPKKITTEEVTGPGAS